MTGGVDHISRCAFVVIKLKLDGTDCLLMRRNRQWRDVNFIGGHQRAGESMRATARRELLEEVPPLRAWKKFELVPLSDELDYGPVLSKSAGREVSYKIQFYHMKCMEEPVPLVRLKGGKGQNVWVSSEDLREGRKHRVTGLVGLLAGTVKGGLAGVPESWPEHLKSGDGEMLLGEQPAEREG